MTRDDHSAAADLSRGAAQVLPPDGLIALLATARRQGRPLRVKFGIDPSGSELTLGHAVVLRKLRQSQDHGHTAVLVIGDFTGTVGDPTGRSAARNAMTLSETTRNAETYLEQVSTILRPDRLEVHRNTEWLAGTGLSEVLAHAQHLTVAQLLERDDFAARYREHRPISLSEFFYPLLQGIDSVAVKADVELGGTDQLFNLTVGRDLQRASGEPLQLVLTMPLLEGLDGVRKMSKSFGNYVALTDTADEQFGKLMSVPDSLIERYTLLCTDATEQDLQTARTDVAAGGPQAAGAKRRIARAVVEAYHGAGAAERAEADFNQRFRHRAVPVNVPQIDLPADQDVHLPALLADARLCSSRAEARRLIDSGAVRLDGQRVLPASYDHPRADLVGKVIQVGRLRTARVSP